nr:hypothetical transcript [Hymenolepis microstoma]
MKEDENNLSSSSDENLQYDQVLASKELKIEQLEAEVLKLKDELGERDRVYDEKVLKLSSQLAEVLDSMELHAKALRDSTIIKRATSDAEGDRDLLDSLQHELKGYRVQSQQYARTICVLEERLLELTREASEAQAEVIRLRAENKLNEKDFFSQGVQTGSDNRIIKNFSLNRHERRCELIELRNEVDALSTLRADLSKEIQQLREQKVIAEAKANDIISTATGKLKQETEAALEINGELHSQLNIAKKQIDELTDTVKKLKSQLSDKEKALIRAKASVQLTRKALNAEEEKVAHLEALEASRRNGSTSGCKHDRPFLRKAPSAESNCQSAGHEETIEAQRTALAEMRQRLHYLSSNTSNGLCLLSSSDVN